MYDELDENWNKAKECPNENCGVKGNCMYSEDCRWSNRLERLDPYERKVFPEPPDNKEIEKEAYIMIGISFAVTTVLILVIITTIILGTIT